MNTDYARGMDGVSRDVGGTVSVFLRSPAARMWATQGATLLMFAAAGCDRGDDGTVPLVDRGTTPLTLPAEEPPVAINPVSPVRYPPALLAQGIEGRVLLRLYVDSAGNLIPDSTRIAESSGYPALDSAALVGSSELRFSPALHQGQAIPAPFLQPVQFRSSRSGTGIP